MRFNDYYTLMEQADIEVLEEKVYAGNMIKQLAQEMGFRVNKIKVDPMTKKYKLNSLSQTGFTKLANFLGSSMVDYKDKKSKKNKAQVVSVYQGQVDSDEGFPEQMPKDPQNIDATVWGVLPKQGFLEKMLKKGAAISTLGLTNINFDQVKARGSVIVMYSIIDENGKPQYFIGVSPRGQEYFKDFLGMPLETYIAANRPADSTSLEGPGQPKKVEEPESQLIDPKLFKQLVPESVEDATEELDEADRKKELKIMLSKKDDGELVWAIWRGPNQQNVLGSVNTYGELGKKIKGKLTKSGTWEIVKKDGTVDKAATQKIKDVIREQPNKYFPGKNPQEPEEVSQTDPKKDDKDIEKRMMGPDEFNYNPSPEEKAAEDKAAKDKEAEEKAAADKDAAEEKDANEKIAADDARDAKAAEEKAAADKEAQGKGEIFNQIKNDLKGKPIELKKTNAIKQGWQYLLKTGGQFFVYINNTGQHKIAYNKDGEDYLAKKNIIKKQVSVNLQ